MCYSKFFPNFRTAIIRPTTVWFIWTSEARYICKYIIYQAYKKIITVLGGKQVRPNIHRYDKSSSFLNKKKGIITLVLKTYQFYQLQMIKEKTKCTIKVVKSNDPRSYRLSSNKIIILF